MSIILLVSSSPELLEDDEFCVGWRRDMPLPLPLLLLIPLDFLFCLDCLKVVDVAVLEEGAILVANVSRRVVLVTTGGANAGK